VSVVLGATAAYATVIDLASTCSRFVAWLFADGITEAIGPQSARARTQAVVFTA